MAYIIHVQTHSHVDTGSFMTQILMRHEIIKQSIKFSQLCCLFSLCTASHCNSCARWKIAARSWCWSRKAKTWDPRPCTWDLYKERKWGNISNIFPLKRQNKSVFCCHCRVMSALRNKSQTPEPEPLISETKQRVRGQLGLNVPVN